MPMKVVMLFKIFCLLAFVPTLVHSLGATDAIQDADPSQSGYLPNHNIHPNIVSSSWAQLWKMTFTPRESWYAKPLVYTPSGKSQMLVTASNMNIVRTLDAVTGAVLNNRTLQPPFLQADAACGDMPGFIGVAGTPIIDPLTDTVYMFSKGYKNGLPGPQGLAAGQYKFFALDVNTLQDRPGFPIIIDGHFADNDPTRYFVGGTVLQRPSLVSLQGVIVGGFGGHCDQFNYTGMVVAVSKTPGIGVTSIFAMESSPGAPTPQPLDLTIQQGGRAAIWQSGMGLVADGNRIFFVTGNGLGHENGAVPASGRQPLSTIDECVTNMKVSSSGVLSLTDYFEPWEYVNLDAADRDFGAAGVSLLDPVFNGTGVNRIAIAGGKTGKIYVMNADALGGFKQGSGGTDGVIQTLTVPGSIFGGPGSYPLEGGYVYFAPVGYPLYCFQFSTNANGNPQFTLAGQSAFINTGRAGVSVPTVTSYQGQPGTGIVWLTDVGVGLKAWNAVPVNGVLVPITAPLLAAAGKYIRPVFGDGRVYTSDSNGGIYAAGPAQTTPLTCTPKPISFGSLTIGSSATQTVTCTATVAIPTVIGCYISNPHFICQNSSLPTGPLAIGASFSFPVVWDLTTATVGNQPGNPAVVLPGTAGSTIHILTGPIAKYASDTPLNMAGTVVDSSPFISVQPLHVDIGGIVLGTGSTGLTSSFTIYNTGSAPLTFTGFAWDDELTNKVYNNITSAGAGAIFANGFSSSAFPTIGSTIAAGGSLVVPVKFLTTVNGGVAIMLTIWSTGGVTDVTLAGSAAPPSVGVVSAAVLGGAYSSATPLTMNFGTVNAQTTVYGNFTLCNLPTSGAQITVTKSSPPTDAEVFAVAPSVDLVVGQKIAIGSCAVGRVQISASFSNPNRPIHLASNTWSISTDGTNPDGTPFAQSIAISAQIIPPQVGVIFSNGTARYQYLGCYYDGGGRQMATQLSYTVAQQAANENGQCQRDCFAAGWAFATTEYTVQCWCGNQPPLPSKKAASDKSCNFACAGSTTQACGGPGTWASVYYDISKWSPTDNAAVSSMPLLGASSVAPVVIVSSSKALVSSTLASSLQSSTLSSSSTIPVSSSQLSTTSTAVTSTSSSVLSSSAVVPTSTKFSVSTILTSSSSSSSIAIVPTSIALSTSSLPSSSSDLLSSIVSSSAVSPLPLVTSSSLVLSSSLSTSAPPSLTLLSSSTTLPSTSTLISLSFSSSGSSSATQVLPTSTLLTSSLVPDVLFSSVAPSAVVGSTSVTNIIFSSTSVVPVSTPTPSKIFPPDAIIIPVVPGQPEVFAAPSGNFTDTLGNGGPLAGFVGYNMTVDAINPPTEMGGIYECLGNCSSTAFGGPYTIAGVEDITCFCANNVTQSASPGGAFVMAGSYQNGRILPRVTTAPTNIVYVYQIIPVANLPDAPPAIVPSSSVSVTLPSSSAVSTIVPSSSSEIPALSSSALSPTSTLAVLSPSSTTLDIISSSSSTVSAGPGVAVSSTSTLLILSSSSTTSMVNSEISSSVTTPGFSSTTSSLVPDSSSTSSSSTLPVLSSATSYLVPGSSSTSSSAALPVLSAITSSLVPSSSGTITLSSTISAPMSTSSSIISQYHTIGCYLEPVGGRALTPGFSANDSMTVEMCAATCGGIYQYFGLEFGRECFCGDFVVGSTPGADGACNMPCMGNPAETCGGPGALTMYNSTIPIPLPPVPSSISVVGDYTYVGCYTEGINGARALTSLATADYALMTNEICAATCSTLGSLMFGTEFGGECYCGNSLMSGSLPTLATECKMPCAGNKAELCGDSVRLSLYSKAVLSLSSVSPSQIKTSSTALPLPSSTNPSSLAVSSTQPIKSSTLPSSSTKLATSTKTSISSLKLSSATSFQSSSTLKTTTTSTALHTTTKSTIKVTTAWSSMGCYSNAKPTASMTIINSKAKGGMSPEICESSAAAFALLPTPTSYLYIGVMNAKTCLGATAAPSPVPTSIVGPKACTVPCKGNVAEKCGGRAMYNLYGPTAAAAALPAGGAVHTKRL